MSRSFGTGYEALDNAFDGLNAGELLVVAGRPGMGKSYVASDMAVWMASQRDNVLYIDLESLGGKYRTSADAWISRIPESSPFYNNIEIETPAFPATYSSLCDTVYENDWADVVIIDYIQLADVDPKTFDFICKKVFPDKFFVWCSMLPRPKKDPRKNRQTIKDLKNILGFVPDTSAILYREEYYSGDKMNELEITAYVEKSAVCCVTSKANFDGYADVHHKAIDDKNEKEGNP